MNLLIAQFRELPLSNFISLCDTTSDKGWTIRNSRRGGGGDFLGKKIGARETWLNTKSCKQFCNAVTELYVCRIFVHYFSLISKYLRNETMIVMILILS